MIKNFTLVVLLAFALGFQANAQCGALQESFNGATPANPPSGWLANGIEFKPSVPQTFNLAYQPATLDSFRAGLNTVGEYVRSRLVTCPDSVKFYWRSSGSANSWAVAIEYSIDNIAWTTLDSIVAPNTTYTLKSINIPNNLLLPNFGIYVRWYMYRWTSGACYVDEICMPQAVCHAVASELRFASATQNCVPSNSPFSVTVQATDANGFVDTTYNALVNLNVQSGGGSLGGTISTNAIAGVATFNNLSYSGQSPVTLGATSGAFTQNAPLSTLNIQATCPSVDTLKIVTYNVLNFPRGGVYALGGACSPVELGPARWDTLGVILNYIKPDIFFVQELQTQGGADTILSHSLNIGGVTKYAMAPFIYNRSTINNKYNNACYYNTEKVTLYKVDTFKTDLRDCGVWIFYGNDPQLGVHGDTTFLDIYGIHTKAKGLFNPSQDSIDRANECQTVMDSIRSKYTTERNGIIGGDMNLYTSNEGAYQNLTTGLYKFNDPIPLNPSGSANAWESNIAYAPLHTQAARASWQNSLECGAKGGLDSRLDFLLATDPIMNGSKHVTYIKGTNGAVGNDGNLFNRRVDTAINSSGVPTLVLRKLANMSDHLPVQMLVEVSYPIVSPLAANEQLLLQASAFNNDVQLTWSSKLEAGAVSTELMCDGKIIFTSTNGVTKFLHKNVDAGTHKYVVRIKKTDGSLVLSNIATATIGETAMISAQPNPFVNTLKVQCDAKQTGGTIQLQLIDAQGAVRINKVLYCSSGESSFDTSTLPAGVYMLVASRNGMRQVVKVVK
ncbi:MAG: hypothetical protein RL660_2220 [Bacteroidota bacterium]